MDAHDPLPFVVYSFAGGDPADNRVCSGDDLGRIAFALQDANGVARVGDARTQAIIENELAVAQLFLEMAIADAAGFGGPGQFAIMSREDE